MSDYCVCKDCGCKHLVWENSCPYCRRIAELEAENKDLLAACEQKQEIINSLETMRVAAHDVVKKWPFTTGTEMEDFAALLQESSDEKS